MNNKKVCVVGLGGVGGYVGCMLAHHYDNIYKTADLYFDVPKYLKK